MHWVPTIYLGENQWLKNNCVIRHSLYTSMVSCQKLSLNMLKEFSTNLNHIFLCPNCLVLHTSVKTAQLYKILSQYYKLDWPHHTSNYLALLLGLIGMLNYLNYLIITTTSFSNSNESPWGNSTPQCTPPDEGCLVRSFNCCELQSGLNTSRGSAGAAEISHFLITTWFDFQNLSCYFPFPGFFLCVNCKLWLSCYYLNHTGETRCW